MKRFKKFFISFMMICMIACQGMTVFASSVSASDGLKNLTNAIAHANSSEIKDVEKSKEWDYSNKTYKCKDGGYKIYKELLNTVVSSDKSYNSDACLNNPINENNLQNLTTGAKNEFLTDYYNAGQSVINGERSSNYPHGITEEVGNVWLEAIQNTEGVGSQLVTTLMSQTKPDFVTANRIYAPFSGTVGTILGVIAILIMAFLAITMVLDLAYIAIPAFQVFIGGEGGNGQGGDKKKSIISNEAIEAVQMAAGGQGGGGQSGNSNKLAVSIYFKKRVLMLIVLCICLLYLVSGNIFALVGALIDLLSGFLGF